MHHKLNTDAVKCEKTLQFDSSYYSNFVFIDRPTDRWINCHLEYVTKIYVKQNIL